MAFGLSTVMCFLCDCSYYIITHSYFLEPIEYAYLIQEYQEDTQWSDKL